MDELQKWKSQFTQEEMKQKFKKLNASGLIPIFLEKKRKALGISKGNISLSLYQIIFEQ